MPPPRVCTEFRLVNGSTGDPVLLAEYPLPGHSVLFDGGENERLPLSCLKTLEAVFITHHHMDHFVGLDRIFRANRDRDGTLLVFGPTDTIRRVHARITAYEHGFYPFEKLALDVRELTQGKIRKAVLEFQKHFPEPVITEEKWKGPVVWGNDHFQVEACPTDHTVPGWAYALVEKAGWHPDGVKLGRGPLRPGPWVADALKGLRAEAAPDTAIQIQGAAFRLGKLAEQYFVKTPGARVTYITDTLWSDTSRLALAKLARKAQRLYCDSYYAPWDLERAQQYHHMISTHAAELAVAAKVEELVLIHFADRYAGRYWDLIQAAQAVFPRVSADLSLAH
jgi:ribonuclease Z